MKRRIFNFLKLSIMVSLLAGCVTTPVVEIEPFDTSVSFEGDFGKSWSKLVQFMSTNDINIGTIEKDSGLITLSGDNLSVPILQQYCDATGSCNLAPKGSVLMVEDDGFITTTVNVKLTATSMIQIYIQVELLIQPNHVIQRAYSKQLY